MQSVKGGYCKPVISEVPTHVCGGVKRGGRLSFGWELMVGVYCRVFIEQCRYNPRP